MAAEIYIWHDAVHEAREGARLHFWRFAFAPDYDRDAIFKTLNEVLQSTDIKSFIVYESFGEYDIMLRLWAPRSLNPEDLGLIFESALSNLSLYEHDYLLVQATALHWVWQDVSAIQTDSSRPTPTALFQVENLHVNEIARYNEQILETIQAEKPVDQGKDRPRWLDDFLKLNLLHPLPIDKHGIKFYVRFDHSRRPLRRLEREAIARQIREVCADVARRTRVRLQLDDEVQLSLYVGTGPMTDFLILARAPNGHFYSFSRQLIFRLLDLDLHHTHNMRTYTEIFADRNFAVLKELPSAQESEADQGILDLPESETLEFKASFEFDVHRYLVTQEREPSRVVTDSIIKAICGLLNAPLGGTLVIGALELERELERVPDRQAAFNLLAAEFPIRPPDTTADQVPEDAKVIFGIDIDFEEWDKFIRRLQDTLRSNIDPPPLAFIDVQRLRIAGRTIAVVRARPAATWFYAKTKDAFAFYVRELASTRAYGGPEADLYRRANPRGDLLS